uniref:Uncharacterized protein n=1 Tax=Anguilla anguilla TaxID=7936 RepID=A0A0E9VTD0_ANGAN
MHIFRAPQRQIVISSVIVCDAYNSDEERVGTLPKRGGRLKSVFILSHPHLSLC